jgi:hypothetical protein
MVFTKSDEKTAENAGPYMGLVTKIRGNFKKIWTIEAHFMNLI